MTDETIARTSNPQCIGENGTMSPQDCAQWLDKKYSRHRELEDQASAQMIRNQAAEIERLRAALSLIGDKCDVVLGTPPPHQHVWDEALSFEKCGGCDAMRPARYTDGLPAETPACTCSHEATYSYDIDCPLHGRETTVPFVKDGSTGEVLVRASAKTSDV